jgi:hypothetical protein
MTDCLKVAGCSCCRSSAQRLRESRLLTDPRWLRTSAAKCIMLAGTARSPIMKSQRLFPLALAPVLSLTGVISLPAQSTRVDETNSSVKITSLTQDHSSRRGGSPLGGIDASAEGALNPSVLEAPASEDSMDPSSPQSGKGGGRSRSKASLSVLPASVSPGAGTSPRGTGSADSSKSLQKPTRAGLANAYGIGGGRSPSSGVSSGQEHPHSSSSPGAVSRPSSGSANAPGGQSSSDGSVESGSMSDQGSASDQVGSASGEASSGFFETFSSHFDNQLFESHFESLGARTAFSRPCGDACSFGKGGPSTTSTTLGASESEESDQGTPEPSSRFFGARRSGNARAGRGAALTGGSRKRFASRETASRK